MTKNKSVLLFRQGGNYMKKVVVLTVLALLILSTPLVAEEVVVRVQDYELTRSEFLETSQEMKEQLDAPEEATDEEINMYIANAIIEDFIINSLIRVDIEKRGLEATDGEIDQEIDNLLNDAMEAQEIDSKEEAFEYIETISGLTEEEIRDQAGDNIAFIKLQLFYMERVEENLSIDMEAEYENYLDETQDPLSFEEFTESVIAQKANELLQQRINHLYEESQEDIEINL